MNNSIKIKQNKFRHLLLILLAIISTLASYHILTGDFSGSDFAKKIDFLMLPVGIVGLLFSFSMFVYVFYRLLKYKYLLIINEEGIVDYSTMSALGFISWSEVTSITLSIMAKRKYISIKVQNIERLLIDKPWYVKKLTQAAIAVGYPPIFINLNSAKENVEDVVKVMNLYLEKWRAKNIGLQSTLKEYER